jgi:hypothetical protein
MQKIWAVIDNLIITMVNTVIVMGPRVEPNECPSLWNWSIVCAALSWITFILLLCDIFSPTESSEDLKKKHSAGVLCCSYLIGLSMYIPTVIRGILGLISLEEFCSAEYLEDPSNGLLLYGSVGIFVYHIVATTGELLFIYIPHQLKVAQKEKQ